MKRILFLPVLLLSCAVWAQKAVYVSASKVSPVMPDSDTQTYIPCGETDTLLLTAVESDICYSFTGWDTNGDNQVEIPASQCVRSIQDGHYAYTAERVVTNVGEDESYTAIFTIKTYKVTVGTDGNGDITINSK